MCSVGIGATLFHRYSDGSERPIANISKTLTASQRNYSQIQKEALAIIYALKKFFQYLYGRKFILVTDHQPLVAMFGLNKPTPALAANRLSRWALFLRQFNYAIEYRRTSEHSNADVLSRLPVGEDPVFDKDESTDDVDTVCTIETLSLQVEPTDSGTLRKESSRDPTLKVMRFTREGWPEKKDGDDSAEKFRKIADSLSVLSWLFTVWSPGGDSDQTTSTSARSFARMPFRHPTDEAVGKDSRLLTQHRFRHSRSMSTMFDLRRASIRTVESCRPPVDVT